MKTFIIAEAGVNHNGSLKLARELIDKAVEAGCDAVKFQSFRAENLVTLSAPQADYQQRNIGKQEAQYEMLKRLELDQAAQSELMEYCRGRIVFLSSPFDEQAVDELDRLGIEQFKIPSGELTNKPFLEHVAAKGKPLILSTGMATLGEIEEALKWVYGQGNIKVTLLHCTSDYPALFSEVNLRAMQTLAAAFQLPVGYSDHTEGIEIPLAAVALGAVVIEKHFTLDRKMEGPDHRASLSPTELAAMVAGIRRIEASLGSPVKTPSHSEMATRKVARKSVVADRTIPAGAILERDMLVCKRPGTGIEPKHIEDLVGKTTRRKIAKDELLAWSDLQ